MAIVTAGCVVPAANGSATPSATESAPTTAASASATPNAPAGTSATPEPAPVPSQPLAFEAPDDILPPASVVVVVVDALQVRAGPSLSAEVVGTYPAGSMFTVFYVLGPVAADGLDWYRLLTAGDAVLWAAAGSGADSYLEVVPAECPAADPDLATLISMLNDWDRLACFGDRPLTLEGTYGCPGTCGPMIAGEFQPTWLTFPFTNHQLMVDYPASPEYLEMRVSPDSELEIQPRGRSSASPDTSATRHPRAAACPSSTTTGRDWRLTPGPPSSSAANASWSTRSR